MESQIVAAFLLGLGGSIHCVGMCGGIVLAQTRPRLAATLRDQALYHFGRLTSYAFLGGAAGTLGFVLGRYRDLTFVQALVSIVLGTLLLLLGLKLAGLFRLPARANVVSLTVGRSLTALTRAGGVGSLTTGALTPLLPCSLLTSALLLAAATGSFTGGVLAMAVFVSGTVPALLVLAAFGNVASAKVRAQIPRITGGLLALFGAFTVVRGIAAFGEGCCHLL
ncbi:MAG: sulfite exporter TauE/SafE family protein [Deltaproteobacteria bacterium]|nr:sulfite exporter TauE/SafE family protein [Deltaproteobacteria bacterium]